MIIGLICIQLEMAVNGTHERAEKQLWVEAVSGEKQQFLVQKSEAAYTRCSTNSSPSGALNLAKN